MGIIDMVKTLVMTVLVVLCLQVKVGKLTLEEHVMGFVYTSEIAEPVHKIAEGGIKLIRDSWKYVISQFKPEVFKDMKIDNMPGNRSIGVQFERSKKYIESKAKKAAERIDEQLNEETLEE